ncbi:MAG: 3'-5' exonuclease, partial [Caulobacteraceae bacterium]
WGAAAEFLTWARAGAGTLAPFDFYGAVLARLDGAGRSMRARLLTRLGAEAEDALDAFTAEVLAAEARGARDLESLAAAMASSQIEVKREQDEARSRPGGEVRVMTVHGAKGLESPIVILPDTTTRAAPMNGGLLDAPDGGLFWAPREKEDCPATGAAREARLKACEEESARLLYVAMTRARDRLIVCGVESQKSRFEASWYDFVQRAFAGLETGAFTMDGGGEALRYGPGPAIAVGPDGGSDALAALPEWAARPAPEEGPAARPLSPSRLGEASRGAAPSPLALAAGLGRYRRGEIIHRLLQILPDLPPAGRAAGADRLLRRELDLTVGQREEMAAAALSVLEDPRFSAVFGPGSKAEVAVAGAAARLPSGMRIAGRIDRLVVAPDRVLVVDFKTNRPAPARIADADPAYIRQMAAYAAVLGEVFPGRRVEAALVWTDGPALMPVPENMIAASLAELARIG